MLKLGKKYGVIAIQPEVGFYSISPDENYFAVGIPEGDINSYQLTVPVQPGNSGGPLFNKHGELIGIINAKHTEAENASYAIKSNYLLNLFNLLDTKPELSGQNELEGLPLSEQVKIIKKFVYIIECE